MLNQTKQRQDGSIELLGELHPLLEQLGTADGLFSIHDASASLKLKEISGLPELATFLGTYRKRILAPLELPAIHRAHHYASHNGCREIIELDGRIGKERLLKDFSGASRRVGRCWLQRLRPLRDERLVQRYLQAVEGGAANGWHTLVFGITLAMYSLPVRQGLLNYARQTLRGFVTSASRPLRLSRQQSAALYEESCADLPGTVEELLGPCEVRSTSS